MSSSAKPLAKAFAYAMTAMAMSTRTGQTTPAVRPVLSFDGRGVAGGRATLDALRLVLFVTTPLGLGRRRARTPGTKNDRRRHGVVPEGTRGWRKYLQCSRNDHAPACPRIIRAADSLRSRGVAGRGMLWRPDPRADRAANGTLALRRRRLYRPRAAHGARARLQRARRTDGRARRTTQADVSARGGWCP